MGATCVYSCAAETKKLTDNSTRVGHGTSSPSIAWLISTNVVVMDSHGADGVLFTAGTIAIPMHLRCALAGTKAVAGSRLGSRA